MRLPEEKEMIMMQKLDGIKKEILKVDVRKEILKDKPLTQALMNAVALDDAEMVRSLVSRGAEVNARDGKGFTPLFYAVIKGNYDIAAFLISHGADVNAKANGNGDAMMYAVCKGDMRLVRLLKSSGCREVQAALQLALKSMKYDMVEVLAEGTE